MNIKFLIVLLLASFFSCNKQKEKTEVITVKKEDSHLIKEKDISKLNYVDFILDERTEAVMVNWVEYAQLEDAVTKVKKGDLSFFKDNTNAIKEFLKNLTETIPSEVNTPAILARVKVLETKIYKLESLSKLSTTSKTELLELTKDFLIAFSNLNLQMNKKIEGDNMIIEKP